MKLPKILPALACPVCGSTRSVSQDAPLDIQRCASCGHVYTHLEESPLDQYDDAYFRKKHKNWFANPNTQLFGKVLDILDIEAKGPEYRLLDLGCGNGDFLKYAARRNKNIRLYGLDLIANTYPGITFFQGDLFTYPFQEQYDAVIALAFIEHVPSPQDFLRKIYSITKPGGVVVLNTVNRDGALYRLAEWFKALGWRGPYERLYDHHHLQHFSQATLRYLVEQSGFRVLRQRAHNFPLKAVDVPKGSLLFAKLYFAAIAVLFSITNVFGGGVHQTLVCSRA